MRPGVHFFTQCTSPPHLHTHVHTNTHAALIPAPCSGPTAGSLQEGGEEASRDESGFLVVRATPFHCAEVNHGEGGGTREVGFQVREAERQTDRDTQRGGNGKEQRKIVREKQSQEMLRDREAEAETQL